MLSPALKSVGGGGGGISSIRHCVSMRHSDLLLRLRSLLFSQVLVYSSE